MFIFVHIPKTAGTSFRKSAESYFGSGHLVFDYGPDAAETSPVVKRYRYGDLGIEGLGRELLRRDKRLFSGHFRLDQYRQLGVEGSVWITFLRHPFQRTVSEFNHRREIGTFEGELVDFIQKPVFRNIQSRMLGGIDALDHYGFIGFTECYRESLDEFNARFGLELPYYVHSNVRRPYISSRYEVSEEIRTLFDRLNADDLRFYETALARAKEAWLGEREALLTREPD